MSTSWSGSNPSIRVSMHSQAWVFTAKFSEGAVTTHLFICPQPLQFTEYSVGIDRRTTVTAMALCAYRLLDFRCLKMLGAIRAKQPGSMGFIVKRPLHEFVDLLKAQQSPSPP